MDPQTSSGPTVRTSPHASGAAMAASLVSVGGRRRGKLEASVVSTDRTAFSDWAAMFNVMRHCYEAMTEVQFHAGLAWGER